MGAAVLRRWSAAGAAPHGHREPAVSVVGILGSAFFATAAAVAVFYLLCYRTPRWLAGYVSVPYTFHLGLNLGGEGLDFQTVIYEAIHRRSANDLAHHGLALDQIAWFALVWHALGWPAVLVLWAALRAQTAWFGERRLTLVLALVWSAIAAVAGLLTRGLAPGTLVVA